MTKNRVNYEGALSHDAKNIINHNFSDVSLCTTQFDAVTGTTGATLTNVIGMATDTNPREYLVAGETYKFRIELHGVATANSGLKIGLKQNNGCTLTSIESIAKGFTASAVAVQHSTTATDAASLFASTSAVIACTIEGTLVVATGGTLQLQAAQNAAHADTTSVYAGSYMTFERVTTG